MKTTTALLMASTMLASSPAFAQQADEAADDATEIVVTAQKREQSLQDVPISIQALGSARLENAQVASFDDYAKLLPSVSFQSFGPGQSQIFFRGVSSGGDGLHIGPLPTSSLYVDETPVTTIAGSVDFHVYDIARVEALAGPQGTLFGASSLSGTLRIITNKPDASGFSGGVDAEVNSFTAGEMGGQLEGFVNLPLSDRAALRVVGFYSREGGYIDNIRGTRTFTLDDGNPATNLTVNNNALVENDYNDVETWGGRAALKVDLDDNWTVTPQIIYQNQVSTGGFLYDPRKGDLKVTDYLPARNKDKWYQAALTIEGKLSNWDVVYSGGYFGRKVDNRADYSYYTVAYDTYGYYATYFPDATGRFIDPTQQAFLRDKYTKQTHEFRVSSPSDKSFRVTAGAFMQRQTDNIEADYLVRGIGAIPTPIWLTPFPARFGDPDRLFFSRIKRIDRDYAGFAQFDFDVTKKLTLTAGGRVFKFKNTIFGFSGINSAGNLNPATCFATTLTDRPCNNVAIAGGLPRLSKGDGITYKFNAAYKFTPDVMAYATLSTGYRPGGNNRRPGVLPFSSDKLTNYEVGAKTQFGRVTFNIAGFYQTWKDLQFGLVPIGQNGVTNTYNAGDARIYGVEADFAYRSGGFSFASSASYTDARLTTDLCQVDPVTRNIVCTPGVAPAAPKGTRLPVQPRFKGSTTVRYQFTGAKLKPFVQAMLSYQGGTRSFLTDAEANAVGPTKGFATADLSAGLTLGRFSVQAYVQNLFDKRGQLSRNTVCATSFCGPFARIYPIKPRIIGLKLGTEF